MADSQAPHIIFLGTAGGPIATGRQLRASGGVVIRIGDHQFHIDPGPGTLVQARYFGVNLRETTAILVTHHHLTHAHDINPLIDAMTHHGFDKKGVLVTTNTVLNGGEDTIPVVAPFYRNSLERYLVIQKDQRVAIDDIEIRATPADHGTEALGFRFFTSKFTLSYLGDTDYTKEVVAAHKKSDILILNVPEPSGEITEHRLNSDKAMQIIKELSPKLAIITHFGVKMLSSDPLYEARNIQKETNIQTIAAKDGMVISPVSYSATLKQKTLNLY